MFSVNTNDQVGKAVCSLIDAAIPSNQSLKDTEFYWYVEDLQDQIITYFNYHRLQEVPVFIDKIIGISSNGAMTDDKKKRYAASVCLATMISLFPFDDNVPQFEPIIDQLLRPGFKRLVLVGAKVVGLFGYLSGPNRDHLVRVLIEKNAATLASPKARPEQHFAAAVVLKELAASAPEFIFRLGNSFSTTISTGLLSGDANVRDICIEIVGILFKSQSASVGLFFLTEFLDEMRKCAAKRVKESTVSDEICANHKLLLMLLRQRPYVDISLVQELIYPVCIERVSSNNFDIMSLSIETLIFLHRTNIVKTERQIAKKIISQLFSSAPKNSKEIEKLFLDVIEYYPDDIRTDLENIISGYQNLLRVLPKNTGPPLVFKLVVATIKIVPDNHIEPLFQIVDEILIQSTVPTPIHILLQALNESRPNWNNSLRRYKQFLVRMIHEELSEPCQRWESVVISFNAIDHLNDLSYPDAIMFHSLVLNYIDSKDWQIRERVAYSSIHAFRSFLPKMPLESMKRLVDLAVDDPVRSVRKKTLFAFTKDVYNFIAQPEIIGKFARLVHDESFMVRKHTIEILGELVPITSASILRDMLLTIIRQLPDKYNPIIPYRISENFPHLIWASKDFLHLYADALYQRFLKMLEDRFCKQTYNDQSLVYMESAQLRDIDGSLIKALSRLNELCPRIAKSGPVIRVLSSILQLPVHPWTKTHALKALKNIAQGEEDVLYIWKKYSTLIQALLKLIRENSSIKLVTKSLKVLGAVGAPPVLPPIYSKKKDIFIFRSFFTGPHEFKRYFIRILFNYLFEIFEEPMIDAKKEVIANVITNLFVADPESIATYISQFFNIFLPSFSSVSPKTLKQFFEYLKNVITIAGRLIVPYVTVVYQAIEQYWRQQFTLECSRVIRALVVAAYGQCDSILHLVVPVCFQLIKFKSQNSAPEIFNLLEVIADYTPSYMTTIIQGITDLAESNDTTDNIIGLCLKTLKFIVKNCDCLEYLPTIKRCVIKLKNNAGIKYRDTAASIIKTIEKRVDEDEEIEDDEFVSAARAPDVSAADTKLLSKALVLPNQRDDILLGKWYSNLESTLLDITPSPVVKALIPLTNFPGLLPRFTFVYSFLITWQNLPDVMKAQVADAFDEVLKCTTMPDWVSRQLLDLVEFSILCEIDLRLDVVTLINFCEKKKYYSKALLFIENMIQSFPIQKTINLNTAVNRKYEARSLANKQKFSMDYKLWMDLGEWELALAQIRKSVDPSRYIYHQVVCMAALEDWDGILALKHNFYQLNVHDRVQIARYFMTAEMWSGNPESALDFLNATNGFSVEDQIMRTIVLIRMKEIPKAAKAVHIGWRYLAATVSAVEKCNKNNIQSYLFQAQQLLELSEVLLLLRKPEELEGTNKVWKGRLKLIENEPDRQKELFKIRALVPNLPHFDAHMLDIISYYIWLGQNNVAKRLCDVFFPDEESDHAKYVQLELIGREEKIDEMLKLAEKCKSDELGSRLQHLVGKIKLKRCNTVEGLKDVSHHFEQASLSQEKIANINILLAHTTNDPSYATLAASAIGKCSPSKPYKHNLFAHILMGIVTNFSANEEVANSVSQALSILPPSSLSGVFYTAFQLLLHSSKHVQDVAYNVTQILISKYPVFTGFQLLSMEKNHSDNIYFENLYDKIQMDTPIAFSQVSLIASQFLKMAFPYSKRFGEKVNEAKKIHQNGNSKDAYMILKNIQGMQSDMSLLDRQIYAVYEPQIKKIWSQIQERQATSDEDFTAYQSLVSLMTKKYESMRVIRLSSVSEHLERKSKWNIPVLGRQSLFENGVKINKFFHCLNNLEGGVQITIIGTDGKRYNYQLRESGKERSIAINQFVQLISSLIDDVHVIVHGSIIQISDNLNVYEIPKNKISMYEMIAIYRQSKQRIVEPEQFSIQNWTHSTYNELDLSHRIEVLRKLRDNYDSIDLYHALLVTSKDADAWSHRTSEFASSLGAMSAVAYILGTVDHSPQQFLIDKTTGSVTFGRFSGFDPKVPVPFRLTPMVMNALGQYGVEGPFSPSFVKSLREIRKRAKAMAPFLQFFCCQDPYEPPTLPMNFLTGFGVEVEEKEPTDIDNIYKRIVGKTESYEEEINKLVMNASDVKNLAFMPAEWAPWW